MKFGYMVIPALTAAAGITFAQMKPPPPCGSCTISLAQAAASPAVQPTISVQEMVRAAKEDVENGRANLDAAAARLSDALDAFAKVQERRDAEIRQMVKEPPRVVRPVPSPDPGDRHPSGM